MRILIGAPTEPGTMMGSYRDGLTALGHDVRGVSVWDGARQSSSPWRRVQSVPLLNRLAAEPMISEGNRALTREAIRWCPDVLLTTGDEILPGTVATIAASTACKSLMIYPDPLVNLQTTTIQALPLYDVVVYCCGPFGLPYFDRLGARRSEFLPFAWDSRLHARPVPGRDQGSSPAFDVVFVGNWRKDREEWLEHLCGVRLGVWGTDYWRSRAARHSVARRSWRGSVALGPSYVKASRAGKITLNLVDTLNGPGLNMRAFEATGMGCFVLSTRTQALEDLFIEGEHIAYFDTPAELREKISYYLDRPAERRRIAGNAAMFANSNTYLRRAEQLTQLIAEL